MTLHDWSEVLLRSASLPAQTAHHVRDSVAAFLVGARTTEGRALLKLLGARNDPAERAAYVAGVARLSECDDIHLSSCVTPGAIVVPVALALAGGCSDNAFHRAIAAGYASGLTLGMAIGGAKALSHGVWPTLLAVPLMAAVTVSCLRGHDPAQMSHAIALALAGINGRAGRPSGAPSGRWFLIAQGTLRGMRAAEAAGQGFRGDLTIGSQEWLARMAGHDDVASCLFEPAGSAPSLNEVGFKPFPIARQGLNAVAAFRRILAGGLDPRHIESVTVFVPPLNVPLLARPVEEHERLSWLCNIGFQLACAAFAPEKLFDSERLEPPNSPLMEFAGRVSVIGAEDLSAHLPRRWAARVVVNAGSQSFEETVVQTPLDRDLPGHAAALKEKFRHLLRSDEARILGGEDPDGPLPHAVLWQDIERYVSIAAQTL